MSQLDSIEENIGGLTGATVDPGEVESISSSLTSVGAELKKAGFNDEISGECQQRVRDRIEGLSTELQNVDVEVELGCADIQGIDRIRNEIDSLEEDVSELKSKRPVERTRGEIRNIVTSAEELQSEIADKRQEEGQCPEIEEAVSNIASSAKGLNISEGRDVFNIDIPGGALPFGDVKGQDTFIVEGVELMLTVFSAIPVTGEDGETVEHIEVAGAILAGNEPSKAVNIAGAWCTSNYPASGEPTYNPVGGGFQRAPSKSTNEELIEEAGPKYEATIRPGFESLEVNPPGFNYFELEVPAIGDPTVEEVEGGCDVTVKAVMNVKESDLEEVERPNELFDLRTQYSSTTGADLNDKFRAVVDITPQSLGCGRLEEKLPDLTSSIEENLGRVEELANKKPSLRTAGEIASLTKELREDLNQLEEAKPERVNCGDYSKKANEAISTLESLGVEGMTCAQIAERNPDITSEIESLSGSVEELEALTPGQRSESKISALISEAQELNSQIKSAKPDNADCEKYEKITESVVGRLNSLEVVNLTCSDLESNIGQELNALSQLEEAVETMEGQDLASRTESNINQVKTQLQNVKNSIKSKKRPGNDCTKYEEQINSLISRLEGLEAVDEEILPCEDKYPEVRAKLDEFGEAAGSVNENISEDGISAIRSLQAETGQVIEQVVEDEACKEQFVNEFEDIGLDIDSKIRPVRVDDADISSAQQQRQEIISTLRQRSVGGDGGGVEPGTGVTLPDDGGFGGGQVPSGGVGGGTETPTNPSDGTDDSDNPFEGIEAPGPNPPDLGDIETPDFNFGDSEEDSS
jgi:hypothetical protein